MIYAHILHTYWAHFAHILRIPDICHERCERRACKIPEKRENYCFGLRLYRSSNVLFYTKCVILHLVCNFTLSV